MSKKEYGIKPQRYKARYRFVKRPEKTLVNINELPPVFDRLQLMKAGGKRWTATNWVQEGYIERVDARLMHADPWHPRGRFVDLKNICPLTGWSTW